MPVGRPTATMGHTRLGILPRTRLWRAVAELLAGGAADGDVISASAIAAEQDLHRSKGDPVFIEAVRLLGLIPQAARSVDFAADLRALGLQVGEAPHVTDLVMAIGRHLDRKAAEAGRSDFGELSRRALIGALASEIGVQLPSLFGSDANDVRLAANQLRQPKDFARLARSFFGRLTSETLASWLDRALSAHVGPGQKFASSADRNEFDRALAQYTSEASRIIQEFATGWYGKTLFQDGTITTDRAARFGAFALTKIGAELRQKRDPHV